MLFQALFGPAQVYIRYPALGNLPETGKDWRDAPQTLTAFLNISLGLIKEKKYLLPIKLTSLKSLDHHSYNSNNDLTAFRRAVFYWAECSPASSRNAHTRLQLPFDRQLQVSWGYPFPAPHILCILLTNHNDWNVISTQSSSVHPPRTFSIAISRYWSWNSSCKD